MCKEQSKLLNYSCSVGVAIPPSHYSRFQCPPGQHPGLQPASSARCAGAGAVAPGEWVQAQPQAASAVPSLAAASPPEISAGSASLPRVRQAAANTLRDAPAHWGVCGLTARAQGLCAAEEYLMQRNDLLQRNHLLQSPACGRAAE